jgi:hypothetical protein
VTKICYKTVARGLRCVVDCGRILAALDYQHQVKALTKKAFLDWRLLLHAKEARGRSQLGRPVPLAYLGISA